MFSTPLLLIIFNRPETTQKVFDVIKQIKPKYLFVAADGPRIDKPVDKQKCEETRKIVEQIDWDCELKTFFREENRGCGQGPAEAITWFFEQVEQGIILEDDCLPEDSFFKFCEELLEKYKNDEKIAMISGTNPFVEWKSESASYIFSKIGFNWGWATWRRAWVKFDYKASLWETDEGKSKVNNFLANKQFYTHYSDEFDTYFKTIRSDVWDFQWLFCRFYHGYYSIVPTQNLITNIGFDENATHTFYKSDKLSNIAQIEMNFPLKHPSFNVDKLFDWLVFERFINPNKRSLLKKIILKLTKYFYQ